MDSVDFRIEVELDDEWETLELWELWLRSSSRARTRWAAGIKDKDIAPYALMVEMGTTSMPPRPLFGRSFDEMAGELNVNDFINKHLDKNGRENPPGLHAIPSFMDPLCDDLGQDFVRRAKQMKGFAPNSEAWVQEKGHRTPWLGRQGRDRMIHDILWPHAIDSLYVWKLSSKRGSPGKKRKSRAKKKPRLTAGKALKGLGKVAKAIGRGIDTSGRKERKPRRRGRKMKMPRINLNAQRFMAVGKSQSKKATKTRFKPKGAKSYKYSYNRGYGR